MKEKSNLQNGWDFSAHLLGADIAAKAGNLYVEQVNEAIEQLANEITSMKSNQSDAILGGFIAESWHARTFNVDAVAAGSHSRAWVDISGRINYGSVDIKTNFGADYSSKYLSNAKASAAAQAQYSAELGKPKYHGQERLVPVDQLEESVTSASRQTLRNENIRPELAESYRETAQHLTDRVKDGKGTESIPLSKKDSMEMARQVRNNEFSPENFGESLSTAIKNKYLLRQAAQAGVTTAAISAAFQLVPDLYKSVDYLIKTGQLDLQRMKSMGTKAISAGAEGFLRGSVSCSLYIACEKGILGEAFKGMNPTALGTVVAIVMETLKNSILVASNRMTPKQMGEAFADSLVISAGFAAGTKIGGMVGSALGIKLPGIGYLVGSLLGSTFAVAYNVGKRKLISFCIDSGFTAFGLVEQNYQLPDEVLADIGLDTIPVPRASVSRAEIPRASASYIVQKATFETVDIKMVKRGIISVNKVEYVLS